MPQPVTSMTCALFILLFLFLFCSLEKAVLSRREGVIDRSKVVRMVDGGEGVGSRFGVSKC